MALQDSLTREIKYMGKTEKSVFQDLFFARNIHILQFSCMVGELYGYISLVMSSKNSPTQNDRYASVRR